MLVTYQNLISFQIELFIYISSVLQSDFHAPIITKPIYICHVPCGMPEQP